MDDTIGVDISKAHLDIYRLSDGRFARFGNDAAGLKALCKWLGETSVRIVYEATGRYHRDLERVLETAGHGLVKVNPARARRFAQATGREAKTDRVDAETLARMDRCSISVQSRLEPKTSTKSENCTLLA